MRDVTFTIDGRRWRLKFVDHVYQDGEEIDGLCDRQNSLLLVCRRLKPGRLYDVIVHEMLHAWFPGASEGEVAAAAKSITSVMRRVYGRIPEPLELVQALSVPPAPPPEPALG